ncbi:Mur ligase family protein [Acidimicrobiaceae bacterium]|nr:Mur ligase family protein [Acidimicrobiaceae bacterium]
MDYKNIYILGIGGSGMSSIGKYLKQKGLNVIGYDQRKSYVTNLLKQDGIEVVFSESDIPYDKNNLYIFSSAIPIKSEKFLELHDKENVISRPEFLKNLSRENKIVGITGTHGKTSTTALLSHIFHFNNVNVSYIYGGVTNFSGIGGHYGDSNLPIILEADEAFNTFENISISDLLVLNIDSDHLDFFENFNNYKNAFLKVMENVKNNLVINNDDPVLQSLEKFNKSVKYGKNKGSDFLILTPEKFLYESKEYIINSQILGDHFRSNMVGAIILAMKNGISIDKSLDAISSFPGVKRRTELIGIAKGISIYDDYGHHPTEMNATISSLKKITKNKLYVVFQPHRYSRTKEYFNLFKNSLMKSDFSIVTDIYPAGEDPIPGISSKNFEGDNIKYLQSTRYVPEYLSQEVNKGDVILTLGAGDITLLGPKIIKYINENK